MCQCSSSISLDTDFQAVSSIPTVLFNDVCDALKSSQVSSQLNCKFVSPAELSIVAYWPRLAQTFMSSSCLFLMSLSTCFT